MATFFVSHLAKLNTTQKERVTCTHCGKNGQEEANCSEIVGYPMGKTAVVDMVRMDHVDFADELQHLQPSS